MPRSGDRMWMVRAGWNGTVAHRFVGNGVVYVNEDGGGPIRHGVSNGEMQRLVEMAYPMESQGAIRTWSTMILNFWYEVQIGHAVVTYDPRARRYHIGAVKSNARREAVIWVDGSTGEEFDGVGYVRTAVWIGTASRDDLSDSARNHLGRPPTLFALPPATGEELRQLCA